MTKSNVPRPEWSPGPGFEVIPIGPSRGMGDWPALNKYQIFLFTDTVVWSFSVDHSLLESGPRHPNWPYATFQRQCPRPARATGTAR